MHDVIFQTTMQRIVRSGRSIPSDRYRARSANSMRAIPLILAPLLLASLCNGRSDPQPGEPGIDEASIDDVWHRAKLRGVAFRAIGQEPPWLLEITNGSEILLVTDYGQERFRFAYVEPVVYQDESRTQYVLENGGVTVEIRGHRCVDSMSGEVFDVSVSIIMSDGRLEGCGRALF